MRDPRLATSHSTSPFTSFPASSEHPSRSPWTTPSSAATTYLASREQHLQGPFSSQPHPQYQRPRMDQRPSRHPEAPTPVRWTTSSSSLQDQPAPPPPVHRVYVLRCSSCDTFLSDRGMRAVLLLKPNIVLFSTDAHPCNAGTLAPEQQQELAAAERTCECLTSSIACHGCGCVVGYHIVSPCVRCTASVQKHQRSANHHRFVFHHDQVTFSERRCFEGEAGVVQTAPLRSYSPSPSSRGSSPSPSTSPEAPGAYGDFKEGPGPLPNLRVPSQPGANGRRSPSPIPPSTRKEGLSPGDTVYWHDLVAGGERAEPIDPKARPYNIPQRAGR